MNKLLPLGFSIVLCTYNGESRLGPTLGHLVTLKIPENCLVELIVINNASTDSTAPFVTSAWLELGDPFPLRLMTESRPGKGYAVETGYDLARYSYILTVDDDNWLSPDYLTTALCLLEQYPDIGILQGHSTGVFEVPPPTWLSSFEQFFIIGSPIPKPGYFPKNNFGVWGAGMVIKNVDWQYLRSLGFSFLTSKVPGKAAGEDYETAIVLLMLGREIYYSDKLTYKHYMPAERVSWNKLKQNFETFGYVTNYLFLYSLVLDSSQKRYVLTSEKVNKMFFKYLFKAFSSFTWKQKLAYFIMPKKEYYQLRLFQYYAEYKWYQRNSKYLGQNLNLLKKWMMPILGKNSDNFAWPHPMA